MNSPTDGSPKCWQDVEDIFEEQFPIGRCKERGQALLVMAYAKILYESVKP